VQVERLKSLGLCVGIKNNGNCQYLVNGNPSPVVPFNRLCPGDLFDYQEEYDSRKNEDSAYGAQDKFFLEPLKLHFNDDISGFAEGTMVVGSGEYLGWGKTNWYKPDAHGEIGDGKFFVYEGDENCHNVNSGLLNSMSSLPRYIGASHYSLHIQWEKMLSVIYAKKKGVLFIRLDNDDEATGLAGGDVGFQSRLNQIIWLLEEYKDGRIPLSNTQIAIYWLDGYKSSRLYNGDLRLIVIDISLDTYENILNLASIDCNTFTLDSPAVIRYCVSPFPSPIPNIRQFKLPASTLEYTMYDLSFQRLSSFLGLINLELTAEENGKTFKELIDLGRQLNPVDGDMFYYNWFKFLLDYALRLLVNHPDRPLIEALRVAIEDDRLEKYLKDKFYTEPKVKSVWNYLFALIWIVVDYRDSIVPRDVNELQRSLGLYGNASVYGVFRKYFRSIVHSSL
jgi:hypothetical protein